MGKGKKIKTNAARLLDGENIKYELIEYTAPEGFLDGVSVPAQGAGHARGEYAGPARDPRSGFRGAAGQRSGASRLSESAPRFAYL